MCTHVSLCPLAHTPVNNNSNENKLYPKSTFKPAKYSAKRKQDFPYTHSDTSRIVLLDNCKFLTDSRRGSLVSTQSGEVIQSDIDSLGGVHLNHPGMVRRPAASLSRHRAGQISVGSGDLDSVRSLTLLLVGRHNYEKTQCFCIDFIF